MAGGSLYCFTDHETILNGVLQKKIELKSTILRYLSNMTIRWRPSWTPSWICRSAWEGFARTFTMLTYISLGFFHEHNQLVLSSLSVFLLEILLNIGPKRRPFWKPRWRPKTGRTNLLPSKFLYKKILTICVPKFTILSRSAHFISYIDLRAPTIDAVTCAEMSPSRILNDAVSLCI